MVKRTHALEKQIIKEFHEAGQARDVQAFKRLLGKHAAHLPAAKKKELIEEFTRVAEELQQALRNRS